MRRQFVQKMPMARQRVGVPPPFTPKSIDGLVLWLDANAGITKDVNGQVSQWDDQSGEDNHAAQSTPASQPIHEANIVNGRPVVRFDGADDFMEFSAITNIRTAFFVVRSFTPVPSRGIILGDSSAFHWHDDGDNMFHSSNSHSNIRTGSAYTNGSVVSPTSLLKPTVFEVITVATAGNVTASRLTRDRGFSDRVWWGDYADVLIYDTPLSSADREAVEEYLADKYGISI